MRHPASADPADDLKAIDAGAALALAMESEARLRALADNLPHAMIYQVAVAPDGSRRFTFVGGSCERLNGVSREAALADPKALYALIAPEDRARHAAAQVEASAAMAPFDIEVGFVLPHGERRWFRLSSAPRAMPDGWTLWDGIQLDVTESHRAREALTTEQERLALVLEATGLGLWDFDVATETLTWDAKVKAVYGLPPEAEVTYADYREYTHPDDRERVRERYVSAMESGAPSYSVEHRTLGPDGVVRWILGCARILRDAAGRPCRIIGSTLELTDRKRAEEHLQLMVHELNHRVKNSMAIVQAIARRTLQTSVTPAEADARLTARLAALARAHDTLTTENWAGADLDAVIGGTAAALGLEPERIVTEGPSLRLRPSAAVTLALVFHELATNAVKYGALSNETGRVRIAWTAEADSERLRLQWRESGGPPVTMPTRRGFGIQLIERGLAGEIGGVAELAYPPEGLVCTVEGPLNRVAAPG